MIRKGKITILLSILLLSITTFGQHQFGVQSGVNLTNANNDLAVHSNFRTGFTGGLNYAFRFQNRFQLGADFLYAQKGFKDKVTFTDELGHPIGSKTTIQSNFDYFSIPIKGGYSIGNQFKGFVNLGVVPSFLLNAETKVPAFENMEVMYFPLKDRSSSIDFGGLIEIGGSYTFKKHYQLFTSFSYQQNFTSYLNDTYTFNGKAYHYGMVVSVGMRYVFGKEK